MTSFVKPGGGGMREGGDDIPGGATPLYGRPQPGNYGRKPGGGMGKPAGGGMDFGALMQLMGMLNGGGSSGMMGGGMGKDLGRGPDGQMGQASAMPFGGGLFGSGSGSNSGVAGLPPTNVINNPGESQGAPVNGGFPGPSGGRFPIRVGPNLPGPAPGFPNEPMPGARGGGGRPMAMLLSQLARGGR